MKKLRFLTALLILAQASALLACGSGSPTGGETSSDPSVSETTQAATEPEYDFPELDCNGETYTILNTNQENGLFSDIEFEEATGEILDDAIFERNRSVEELFNFELAVENDLILTEAANAMQTAVLAGDAIYDFAFIRDQYIATSLIEGYLKNLDDIPEIRLDEEWWDGEFTDQVRAGKNKEAFITVCDTSLVDFQGTMVTFINEDMIADVGLELPYQLVRDGKWTFDKLCEYMKSGINLNGDDSFAFDGEGNSIYGMAGYERTYDTLIFSSGTEYIAKDSGNNLSFNLESEKFYEVATKISQTFFEDGMFVVTNTGGPTAKTHYENVFKSDRCIVMIAQMKAANNYRDMTSTYGIVPTPKWDESDENYRSLRTYSFITCVPVTNQRTHETGIIMDALAYLSHRDVIPKFYEERIEQKILRNEESIEMLEIIRATRCSDLGFVYGKYSDISSKIMALMKAGSTDFASTIASLEPTIEAHLADIMESLDG